MVSSSTHIVLTGHEPLGLKLTRNSFPIHGLTLRVSHPSPSFFFQLKIVPSEQVTTHGDQRDDLGLESNFEVQIMPIQHMAHPSLGWINPSSAASRFGTIFSSDRPTGEVHMHHVISAF